jgi:hypothetical protein
MGYLICEKCEGFYELKEGESPEDFSDKCECGGKLEYVDTIEGLKNYDINEDVSNVDNNQSKIKLKSVGIGAISSLLIFLIIDLPKLLQKYMTYDDGIIVALFMIVLAPLIGGFIASYSCGRCNYKYGVVNSIIAIFIYNIVMFLTEFYFHLGTGFGFDLMLAVIIEIFGIIGGVLGIFIKKQISR